MFHSAAQQEFISVKPNIIVAVICHQKMICLFQAKHKQHYYSSIITAADIIRTSLVILRRHSERPLFCHISLLDSLAFQQCEKHFQLPHVQRCFQANSFSQHKQNTTQRNSLKIYVTICELQFHFRNVIVLLYLDVLFPT